MQASELMQQQPQPQQLQQQPLQQQPLLLQQPLWGYNAGFEPRPLVAQGPSSTSTTGTTTTTITTNCMGSCSSSGHKLHSWNVNDYCDDRLKELEFPLPNTTTSSTALDALVTVPRLHHHHQQQQQQQLTMNNTMSPPVSEMPEDVTTTKLWRDVLFSIHLGASGSAPPSAAPAATATTTTTSSSSFVQNNAQDNTTTTITLNDKDGSLMMLKSNMEKALLLHQLQANGSSDPTPWMQFSFQDSNHSTATDSTITTATDNSTTTTSSYFAPTSTSTAHQDLMRPMTFSTGSIHSTCTGGTGTSHSGARLYEQDNAFFFPASQQQGPVDVNNHNHNHNDTSSCSQPQMNTNAASAPWQQQQQLLPRGAHASQLSPQQLQPPSPPQPPSFNSLQLQLQQQLDYSSTSNWNNPAVVVEVVEECPSSSSSSVQHATSSSLHSAKAQADQTRRVQMKLAPSERRSLIIMQKEWKTTDEINHVLNVLGSTLRSKADPYIDTAKLLHCNPAMNPSFPRGGVKEVFPFKLFRMLQEVEAQGKDHIIGFLSHGRAFTVHKMDSFLNEILPRYYNGKMKWSSFSRQLNLYGFHRVSAGRDLGAYYHELFLKGHPDMCHFMRRVGAPTGLDRRRWKLPEGDDPDFYSMPPVG